MKTSLSIFFFFISLTIWAQAPQFINYQGVARNNGGTPIVGNIAVKVDIHKTSPGGVIVCSEVFNVTTNAFGIFNVRIGSVSPSQFGNIVWGTGTYYAGVSIDPNNGSNFGSEISNQQLVSVPYALYAEKAGNAAQPVSVTTSTNATVTTIGTNSFNIDIPNYVAGSNLTITPIGGNSYQLNAAGASPTTAAPGPWTGTAGSVYLTNSSDNVGIGINPFNAKLDVLATVTTGIFVSSPAIGVMAITSSSSPTHCAVYGNNQGGSPSGPAVAGVNSSQNAAAISATNSGAGPGIYGNNSVVGNNPNAYGVWGETRSTSTSGSAIFANNLGQGYGLYATTASTNSSVAAILGIDSTGDGVRGQSAATQSAIAGVKGINNGTGPGVYGFNNANASNPGSNGVRGESNASNPGAAGVSGETFGPGSGVHGISNTNGPAVRAQSGVSGTLALWVDAGHIRSTQQNAPAVSTFTTGGGITAGSYTLVGCTDVKGSVVAVATTTGLINPGGQLIVKITFSKAYTNNPIVVITPANDFLGLTAFVTAVTPQSFEVVIKNSTATSITASNPFVNFNYFVIE